MSIVELLTEQLRGKQFTSKQYPTLGGIVREVISNGDQDSNPLTIVFEDKGSGVDGRYAIHDFYEEFSVEEHEPNIQLKS